MVDHPNAILSKLDDALFRRLIERAKTVELPSHHIIAETHQTISHVYFPTSGVISNVVELIGGGAIETAMVGRDGVFGAANALDDKISLNHVVMQVAGSALTFEADFIVALAEEFPAFRRTLLAYEQFATSQMQQTAACNAVHRVEQRLCKWLLRIHDLAGDDLMVTQDFLAQMMGVRRSSVTEVAQQLAHANLISYGRGRIKLIDIDGLHRRTCECHDQIRDNYARLTGAV